MFFNSVEGPVVQIPCAPGRSLTAELYKGWCIEIMRGIKLVRLVSKNGTKGLSFKLHTHCAAVFVKPISQTVAALLTR